MEENNEKKVVIPIKKSNISFFPKDLNGWINLIIIIFALLTAYFYYKDVSTLSAALELCQNRSFI